MARRVTGSLSLKRVRRKGFKRHSGLSFALRWALCVPAFALIAARADTSTARAETNGAAEEERLSCEKAVTAAEVSYGIPQGLLRAVARTESGWADPKTGTVVAWPWTLNAEGESQYHATKAEALTALRRLHDRGIENVDVGCLQINLNYHEGAFTSMEQALDPEQNARYGASFLRALYAATGSWSMAVSRYHSATPDLGEAYGARVMAAWRDLGGRPNVMQLPPATSAAGRYIQADVIARILTESGIPVPAEILYLQMRGGLRHSKSATPRNAPEDLRNKTNETSGYDATAARERFVNPWASPTNEEDSAVTTRSQSPSATSGFGTSRANIGVLGYGGSRNERMQRSVPVSRFDRRRGYLQ